MAARKWLPETGLPSVALLAMLVFLALSTARGSADAGNLEVKRGARAKEAFATLLYSDEFLLGVRVLGQSLRETGTTRDLVVLVTEGVSQQAADTLALDGWRVHRVGLIANPGTWTEDAAQRFPQRFYGVYTKLRIFNLTQYERVAYLDADTIAARNLDELFLCDGLCAAMRHSERVNSGVVVLTPSVALLEQMLSAVASTPSYTGGDQGFLNSFLVDFPEAPLFDPRKGQRLSEASSWRSAAPGAVGLPLGRLPTLYNADLGLFIMNSNHWMLPPEEIRVLHFTLATFKPWDWWAGWIMGETSARWQALRSRLPPAADGHPGGQTAQQQLAALVLLPLPAVLAALLFMQQRLRQQGLRAAVLSTSGRVCRAAGAAGVRMRVLSPARPPGSNSSSPSPSGSPQPSSRLDLQQQLLLDSAAVGLPAAAAPAWLTAAAAGAGVAAVLAGLGCSMLLIPRQVAPAVGVALAYEWTALSVVLLFSFFLKACYRCALPPGMALGGGQRWPWGPSLALFGVILASLGLVPWWADMLGVRSFAGKAITTFLLGALSGIVSTQCFISLAARWYQCGVTEAAATRVVTKLGV